MSDSKGELRELDFHRLLVAVDGSENAELALRAAVTAAHRDNAAITLITVAPDVRNDSRFAFAMVDSVAIQQDADTAAERLLREAVERMPDDIPVTTVFRRGRPGPEIVAHSKEAPYDGILVGARGLGRVGALMGSVSQYVLHHAQIAVFVAHAAGDADPEAAEPDTAA